LQNIIIEKDMSDTEKTKLEIFSMINTATTVEEISEIKDLLVQYFANKAQRAIDALWDSGNIDERTIEEWGSEHMRTPYKYALRRS